MSASSWAVVGASVVALVPAGARWLRVAQREHYLAGSASRFAFRWWFSAPGDIAAAGAAVAGVVLAGWWPLAALATVAAVVVAPTGLSVRGRSSPLHWSRRLRTLAVVWVAIQAVVVAVGVVAGAGAPVAAAGALAVPAGVDLACWLTAPFERRRNEPFVVSATERLRRVAPLVVGITGSYGKTSTKNHVAHLVAGTRTVVPSPASFNNRMGLARAVNEHLAEGTEVFVAEMGTYGPGEIAELCAWCPPAIAVITAIGPVHLERFGSEDRILEAKSEITERAGVVVLAVDDARLGALADRLDAEGSRTVVRCSAVDHQADVCVERTEPEAVRLWVSGKQVADLPLGPGAQPANLACAVAVALRLGVPPEVAAERLASLPAVPNRLASGVAGSGVVVFDDTFNSNPAGARAALRALAAETESQRRAVVTPGMVELGRRQAAENRAFAEAAVKVATDLVVVGRTNRRALVAGGASLRPVRVRTRDEAVSWVRAHLGAGDAVLYENDLPDHYP